MIYIPYAVFLALMAIGLVTFMLALRRGALGGDSSCVVAIICSIVWVFGSLVFACIIYEDIRYDHIINGVNGPPGMAKEKKP